MPRGEAGLSAGSSSGSSGNYRILNGVCPDPKCQTKLHFLSLNTSVECTSCGQRHDISALLNVAEAPRSASTMQSFLQSYFLGSLKPERGPDNIKVHGLSNYVCKLLSPILSRYGMDNNTGSAKLLTELGKGETFDCAMLCDRAFLLDPEHIDISGYGRDHTGSATYLAATLNVVKEVNDNEERLIPIHADGDGHCLVHAVSRALVGRELFWHALRLNLKHHLCSHLEKYKELFKNFVDIDEWQDIIDECDPNFVPKDFEPVGLRNIHIFGLANVLHRPIILLDNLTGMESSGDYSGVFLPALMEPEDCRGKDGTLNKPICIAWSSPGRNHFIPLVGVKGKACPLLPRYMLQRAWGVSSIFLDKYIEFSDNCCAVGGAKCLQDRYLQRLVSAMEEVFLENHGVHPTLVAEVHQYSFKSQGFVGAKPEMVIEETKTAIRDGQLFRCLTCESLVRFNMSRHSLGRGGSLYKLAKDTHKELLVGKLYRFPTEGITCRYDKANDVLVPDLSMLSCHFCSGDRLRTVHGDGSIAYQNGDRTLTPAGTTTKCLCGFKHYWDGKLYDNLPELLVVPLEWNGKKMEDTVYWFQDESDPQLNSNVYQVAQELVQKHFPGEFGSERLVQKVVDTLLRQTATRAVEKGDPAPSSPACTQARPKWASDEASKIILSGFQKQSVHKEELMKSEAERQVKQKISAHAPQQQARKSSEGGASSHSGTKSSKVSGTPDKTSANTSPQGSSKSTPTATPPSTPKSAAGGKKIRVSTSDGRNEMLTLTKDLTFAELQALIERAVDVPPAQQKLRRGFPPQELRAPAEGEEDQILPISHGDKILLEILPAEPAPTASTSASSQDENPAGHWGLFDRLEHMPQSEALLDKLKEVQHTGDSVDSAVVSLGLIASLSGKDLWSYVQREPHLFSVGGLFYKQVQRDLGLTANKHCTLPALPGKVFVYNEREDRLELCLEPYGHFAIQPDIENSVMSGKVVGSPLPHSLTGTDTSHSASGVTFGTSGALGGKASAYTHGHQRAFAGQGHTLRSASLETRMPTDVPMTGSNRHEVRRLMHFCDPAHKQESIEEEPEGREAQGAGEASLPAEKGAGDSQEKYLRKGPGFSVLRPKTPPSETEDAFRQLVQQIEDTMGNVADMDEEGEQAEKGVEKEGEEGAEAECMSAEEDGGDEKQTDEKMETT